MRRKVFISFLGAGFYYPAFYIAEGQDESTVELTRFVQQATISNYCKNFSSNDTIYIFTTKGALVNWYDNEHKEPRNEKMVFYEGLQNCLKKLNLPYEVKNIDIPDGQSPNELWDIFKCVFDVINESDELTFDITHGFRTLPMFNIVLINYAKFLKNITVAGIYYGNYESRYERNGKIFSPIWNLKDFELLEEWANTANLFLKTGNAIPLTSLINAEENIAIKKGLQQFSEFVMVNRGMNIISGEEIVNLRGALIEQQEEISINKNPLSPILQKIRNEFDLYKENSPINGFLAVKWAIKNGLIQQAATLLEEAVTSFVLFDIGQEKFLNDETKRTKASAAITIGTETIFSYTPIPEEKENDAVKDKDKRRTAIENLNWEMEFVPIIRDLPYKKKLGECVNSIKNSIRNDINHAGFRKDARSYKELEQSLKKRYKEIRKILKDINKLDLPEL